MTLSDEPATVWAAPSHRDPYPYYARLARERKLRRDAGTGAWIAADAAAVRDVLTSPLCRTRPPDRVVPDAIAGTPAAEVYRRLVRIVEGEAHCPLKSTLSAAIEQVDFAALAGTTRQRAAALASALDATRNGEQLTKFIYALPAEIIAGLVGVPESQVGDVARWVGAYGAATAAAATGVPPVGPAVIDAGSDGARQLLDFFRDRQRSVRDEDRSLFADFAREAARAGRPDAETVIVNGIGVMAQGFAATASLIGLTLLALSRHPDIAAALRRDRSLLGSVVEEVLRCDPVTQSLPRFVASDGVVAGETMRAGDVVVAVIAAANRDPALNAEPNRFAIERRDRQYFEFGAGAHACAGGRIATVIAETAIDVLLDRDVALDGLEERVSYRPSAHIRMPVFAG